MYFIPRNNRVYHYIAHTRLKNRYLFTGFFVAGIIFFSVYFIQRIITVYTVLYAQQVEVLKKQYKEGERIGIKNKQLTAIIQDTKKEIEEHVFLGNSEEYFKNQLLFILNEVKNNGLKLNSYGIQKEKSYEWYKKEIAHFDLTGSLKQVIDFFKVIKNSKKMVSVRQVSLVRVDEQVFHVHCDIEFILVLPDQKVENKSLQL